MRAMEGGGEEPAGGDPSASPCPAEGSSSAWQDGPRQPGWDPAGQKQSKVDSPLVFFQSGFVSVV